jgi:hypothetical protein
MAGWQRFYLHIKYCSFTVKFSEAIPAVRYYLFYCFVTLSAVEGLFTKAIKKDNRCHLG